MSDYLQKDLRFVSIWHLLTIQEALQELGERRYLRPVATDYWAPDHLNGFANANIMAIPTPIRNAASIKPAKRNILVCSLSISSG